MNSIIQTLCNVISYANVLFSHSYHDTGPPSNLLQTTDLPRPCFPDVRLNHVSHNILCGDRDAHLTPSLWALAVLLFESERGIVSFDETCEEPYLKKRPCPWRKKLETAQGSRRSAASRLSTLFWNAGIPYRVMYSHRDDTFTLIPNPDGLDSCGKIPLVIISSHRILESGPVHAIQKSLKDLKTQVRLLQKFQYHELERGPLIIPPVLTDLPKRENRSKT